MDSFKNILTYQILKIKLTLAKELSRIQKMQTSLSLAINQYESDSMHEKNRDDLFSCNLLHSIDIKVPFAIMFILINPPLI